MVPSAKAPIELEIQVRWHHAADVCEQDGMAAINSVSKVKAHMSKVESQRGPWTAFFSRGTCVADDGAKDAVDDHPKPSTAQVTALNLFLLRITRLERVISTWKADYLPINIISAIFIITKINVKNIITIYLLIFKYVFF